MTHDRQRDVLTPATLTSVEMIEEALKMEFSEEQYKKLCMILMDYYCTVAVRLLERNHQ